MEEQLINFETANLAKEKGFNIPVLYDYNNGIILEEENRQLCNFNDSGWKDMLEKDYNSISAPTQSLLQKWLREEYNIAVLPFWTEEDYCYFIHTDTTKSYSNRICSLPKRCNSFEKALEKGLQEALKLI